MKNNLRALFNEVFTTEQKALLRKWAEARRVTAMTWRSEHTDRRGLVICYCPVRIVFGVSGEDHLRALVGDMKVIPILEFVSQYDYEASIRYHKEQRDNPSCIGNVVERIASELILELLEGRYVQQ